MNWYMETELRHGTTEWDILRESFPLTLSFEDGFDSIDEVLQEMVMMSVYSSYPYLHACYLYLGLARLACYATLQYLRERVQLAFVQP